MATEAAAPSGLRGNIVSFDCRRRRRLLVFRQRSAEAGEGTGAASNYCGGPSLAGTGFNVTWRLCSGRLWAGEPRKTRTSRFPLAAFVLWSGTMAGTRTLRGISASLPYEGGVRRGGWGRSMRVHEPRSRHPRSRCARWWINGSRVGW